MNESKRMKRGCPFPPRPLCRFLGTTKQSAPVWPIGTFGPRRAPACAFSLNRANQVLKFRTKARMRFTRIRGQFYRLFVLVY